MSFRLRRGLDADRQTIVFDEGELIYVTDTKKIFIGDGTTTGAIDIIASTHDHNSLYYLKGEVDTLLQNLGDSQEALLDAHTQNLDIHREINDSASGLTDLWSAQKITQELATKASSTHIHDDRYYTETEVDGFVNTINSQIALGETKVDTDDVAPDVLLNKVGAGQGITVYKDAGGADNILRVGAQVYIATIGGQPKPVYVDSSKGGKVLSVEMSNYWWAEAALSNNDWVQIGHASDADSGWIMPFDGTIVGVTAHCENNSSGNPKDMRLYVNGTQADTSFITIPTGTNQTVNDQTKNFDFSAGDRLRFRAGSSGGTINDTVISLMVKWRA